MFHMLFDHQTYHCKEALSICIISVDLILKISKIRLIKDIKTVFWFNLPVTVVDVNVSQTKVETAQINWLKTPECLSGKHIYSPASLTEVKYLSSKYNLKRFIYSDFIRLNETIFYRNVWTLFRKTSTHCTRSWDRLAPVRRSLMDIAYSCR